MRQRLVLCSIAALAAAQLQCGPPPDDTGTCADAGAAAATQRFKIDINVDGEPRPLGFLRGDDLNEVARRWVASNAIVGEDAVRMLVKRMRTKVEEAPALDGEALGCPALAYEHKMETPASLAAFTRHAYEAVGAPLAEAGVTLDRVRLRGYDTIRNVVLAPLAREGEDPETTPLR